MNPELRTAAAHVFVDSLEGPQLDPDDAHHLSRVLRLRDGEVVTASDGAGSWRRCRWTGGAIEPDGPIATDSPGPDVTIALAIPKQGRPDWIVQKATEIGVRRLVWLHAERSVVRWDERRASGHLERHRRIAREAASQSRRTHRCEIDGPVPASTILPDAAVAEPGGGSLSTSDRVIAIGPEGGWSPAETSLAASLVDLGDRVLRTETAALVAATLAVHLAQAR